MDRKKTIRQAQVRVAVGLSGGVDSAVSAKLLLDLGYEVVGVHIYCWPPKSEIEKEGVTREEWMKKNGCRADEDRSMALKTALELGIPFKVLDFSEEYNQRVIKYFYEEYQAGRTPNPDVMCNSEIKFGLFLDWALENSFDFIATGHYAKLSVGSKESNFSARPCLPAGRSLRIGGIAAREIGSPQVSTEKQDISRLFIPKDKHKDQTYFLWKLTQKELAHVLFPLGDLEKSEVREIAKKAGLSVATRPDSQGICFVGSVEAREFLERRLKPKTGIVKNVQGEVMGEHDGVWFYTIGQRGGWTILPQMQKKYTLKGETPIFYIMDKKAETNELVVGLADEALGDHFVVKEVNWITDLALDSRLRGNDKSIKLLVRIRHGGELMLGTLDSEGRVTLEKPVRGIASGQSAVFYSGEGECLGGGIIG